jgi:hypothetical protein
VHVNHQATLSFLSNPSKNTRTMASVNNFEAPLLYKLPLEIRLLIWELALGPRVMFTLPDVTDYNIHEVAEYDQPGEGVEDMDERSDNLYIILHKNYLMHLSIHQTGTRERYQDVATSSIQDLQS